MQHAAFYIARRYLISKKRHNAINIVSGVSAAAVAVVTAALICVMSVMNGFEEVIESMFSRFDADLRIEAVEGKTFRCDTPAFERMLALPFIAVHSEVIEETALVEHADKQLPALLKGVDADYEQLTEIDSILTDGTYSVDDGAFYRAVLGQGLAGQLGIGAHFVKGLHVYAPKRNGRVNMMRPDKSFNRATCYIAGIFAVQQAKYDDRMMLVSIDMMRTLFDYAEHEVTAIELGLTPDVSVRAAKRAVAATLGVGYRVADRYEQQADFFRIVRIEKLLTVLLLSFILLIASFNLIGSLTMLILDKEQDMHTLRYLGADDGLIRQVFRYEGRLIAMVGAAAGVVIGIALCLSQEHYGWLKMGSGAEYVLSAYPVALHVTDIVVVVLIVTAIGWLTAWIPTRNLKSDET